MSITLISPNGFSGKQADEGMIVFAIRQIATQIPQEQEYWAEKYGVRYDSDTFAMSPFCWCDESDCPQCWDEEGLLPDAKTISRYGIAEDEDGYLTAPDFWHKPTGLKVWWYKYIGRGMKVSAEFNPSQILSVLASCLAEINRNPNE